MDVDNIPRRERRHYRQYKDGEIVYSGIPINKNEKSNSKVNAYSQETKVKSLLDIDEKKEKGDNNIKIEKVLNNLSEIISPDVDVVAEAIYNQIKNDDFYNFEKTEIKKTIKSSRHYRATRDSKNNKDIIASDNMKSLVEDVFMQMDNEQVKPVKKKEDKESVKKEKKKKNTETKVSKKTKKKEDIQDLLDEGDDSLDLEDSDEDDLGLKF